MSAPPEEFAPDEAHVALRTHGDVQRALARCLRRVEKGPKSMDLPRAHLLVIGYGTLAKMMREGIADDIEARLETLEAKTSAGPDVAAPH